MSERIRSFRDFWPFYLGEHRVRTNRMLHIGGTTLGAGCWLAALWKGSWGWFVAGPLLAYGLAWIGHFLVEGNRPATFRYPVYSFFADLLMALFFYTGRLESELRRHGVAG